VCRFQKGIRVELWQELGECLLVGEGVPTPATVFLLDWRLW
jgi:hypothetical protein